VGVRIFALAGQRVALNARVNGTFTNFDTTPEVTATLVNGVATALTTSVVQEATGLYSVILDASSLALGDTVRIVGAGVILGQSVTFQRCAVVNDECGFLPGPVVPDPLSVFDDPFDDNEVGPQWGGSPLNATFTEGADGFAITNSNTISRQGTQRAWHGNGDSSYLRLALTGDFRMTAEVTLTNLAGNAAPPNDGMRLGGIIVEGVNSGIAQPNYIGALFGTLNPGNTLGPTPAVASATGASFVVQNCIAAVTDQYADGAVAFGAGTTAFQRPGFSIPSGGASMNYFVRACRTGQDFTMMLSLDGGVTWPISETITRLAAEMPATVNAGLVASEAWVNPTDLIATYRSAQFETVGGGFAPSCG